MGKVAANRSRWKGGFALCAVVIMLLLLSGCDATQSAYNKAVSTYKELDFTSAKTLFAEMPEDYQYARDYLDVIAAVDALESRDWQSAISRFVVLYQRAEAAKGSESVTHQMAKSDSYKKKREQVYQTVRDYLNSIIYPLDQKIVADALPLPRLRPTGPVGDEDHVDWDNVMRTYEDAINHCLYQHYDEQVRLGKDITKLPDYPFVALPLKKSHSENLQAAAKSEPVDEMTEKWLDRLEDWQHWRARSLKIAEEAKDTVEITGKGLFIMDDAERDPTDVRDFAGIISPFYFADRLEDKRYLMRFDKTYAYDCTYTDGHKGYNCNTVVTIEDVVTGETLFTKSYEDHTPAQKWSGSDYYAPYSQDSRLLLCADIAPLLERLFVREG